MASPLRLCLALTVALLVGPAAVATSATGAAAAGAGGTSVSGADGAGLLTETFVDTHRGTAAWGPNPARNSRTLVTSILYPTARPTGTSPIPGADPDRTGAPYPLIVFAHGLGGSPAEYMTLLSSWAEAGFVVAAPLFPLSSGETPGGPDAADVVNQPGDMRFVIDRVLALDTEPTSLLHGLVDPHEVGAAGHSNGAITTLGLVSNTCCKDAMVKAAVVMAGTTEGFSGGHYELRDAPPLLLVHDTADPLIPYRSAVQIFNQSRGPKGLLTIRGTSGMSTGVTAHMAASGVTGPSSAAVIKTTTDFFDAYLKGETAALRRISSDGQSSTTTIHFDGARGGQATLPVPAAPVVHLKASVMPSSGLTNGQTVTVQWSGYTAGKVVNVLECSKTDLQSASSAGCDFSNAKILEPDPTGTGSLTMPVVTGAVGDGVCDTAHNHCSIIVNDGSSTDPAYTVVVPVHFST
jgi:dienelactone hydrolase